MAFDTFDEGVSLGGMRSKTEIRTLICYMLKSVGSPMRKDTIVNALMEKGLANYFETSSSFDDLVRNGNIELTDADKKLYTNTPNGDMIATQLEDTLAPTVKERAIDCALTLLRQEQVESENKVTISKCDNGYNVTCKISGGDMELFRDLYNSLLYGNGNRPDVYFILADFKPYAQAQERVEARYRDEAAWARKALARSPSPSASSGT